MRLCLAMFGYAFTHLLAAHLGEAARSTCVTYVWPCLELRCGVPGRSAVGGWRSGCGVRRHRACVRSSHLRHNQKSSVLSDENGTKDRPCEYKTPSETGVKSLRSHSTCKQGVGVQGCEDAR